MLGKFFKLSLGYLWCKSIFLNNKILILRKTYYIDIYILIRRFIYIGSKIIIIIYNMWHFLSREIVVSAPYLCYFESSHKKQYHIVNAFG